MLKLNLRYHLKNLLLLTPFSYGHYRRLQKYRDVSYDFEKEKHPLREKHHGNEGWKTEKGTFHYRDYASYEEYKTHQVQKYKEMLSLQGGFGNREILEYRRTFFLRFRDLPRDLDRFALILCLGARQGTEVEVLRDLGYRNALGLDLNPGPENPYVKSGDFMALEYPDNSVDMLYSNCVDHAFDLEKFFAEHVRVLKPGGYALYDIAQFSSGAGSFEAVEWESEEAVLILALKSYRKVLSIQARGTWKWMLFQK